MTQTLRTQVTAAVAAVVLVSFFVLRTSQAAFTGSTTSAGNTFTAGTVSLTNDAPTGATWSPAGVMGPGDSVTGCVVVTYDGSLVPNNAVTMAVASDVTGMDASMDVAVDVAADCATNDGAADLTGTLASLGAGSSGWTPSGNGDSRGFWVTVTMNPSIDNSYQGQAITADFTWSVVDDG